MGQQQIVHIIPMVQGDCSISTSAEITREDELYETIACIEKLPPTLSVHYLDSLERLAVFAAADDGNLQRIRKLVESARIRPGPFLVRSSFATAGGECLIRNLLFGQRVTERLGLSNRYILLPGLTLFDGQVPQILQDFNIDGAYLDWRGSRSGEHFKVAEWQGPDQSQILVIGFPRMPRQLQAISYTLDPDVKVPDLDNLGCELQMLAVNANAVDIPGANTRFPSNLIDFSWAVKERIDPKRIRSVGIGAICVQDGKNESTADYDQELSYQYRVRRYRLQAYLQILVEPLQLLTECLGIQTSTGACEEDWKQLLSTYANRQSGEIAKKITALQGRLEQKYVDQLTAIRQNIDIESDSPEDFYLVVWNPLTVKRTQILPATISIPKRDNLDNFILKGLSGREVKYQIIDRREVKPRFGDDGKRRLLQFDVLAELRNIPPMGYAIYRVSPHHISHEYRGKKISEDAHQLENEFIRVAIEKDGRFSVFSKETGSSYEQLGQISDETWHGVHSQTTDYQTSQRSANRSTKIECLHNGSLQATFHIHHTIRQNHASAHNSSNGETNVTEVHLMLRLHRNSRFVELDLDVVERCADHRVWMHFPVDFQIENHSTRGFFSTVFREKDGKMMVPKKIRRDHLSAIDWIGFSDDLDGYAIFLDGYAEYRRGQNQRDIAILLSECSQQNGHHQRVQRRFAFYPYLGSWECGQILHDHRAWCWGFSISQIDRSQGPLPSKASFLSLEPSDAVFSSIKGGEDGDDLIVRIYNPTDQFIKAKLRSYVAIRRVSVCTLEELELEELSVQEAHSVGFEMDAYKIVTLRLGLESPAGTDCG